jgi:hypothetical protein
VSEQTHYELRLADIRNLNRTIELLHLKQASTTYNNMHVSKKPELAYFKCIITKEIGTCEDPEVEGKINFIDSEHLHTVGCAITNDAATNECQNEQFLINKIRMLQRTPRNVIYYGKFDYSFH